jgi:nitroreductase
MDVIEAMKRRRSVRAYSSKEVSDAAVETLLECARWAPSAGNLQPWEFIVVRDSERKRGLAEAALGQSFIEDAPAAIVVCANSRRSATRYGSRGASLYCLQDTAAATQNIHLAAYALGLATCWVGAFDEAVVARVLKLPEGIRPVVIIPVGYPEERPSPPPRRGLSEIVHKEEF